MPRSQALIATAVSALWCCLAAAPGGAQVRVVDTIETMVADADVVVVGRLRGLSQAGVPTTKPQARAHLTVVEVIKGRAAPAFTVIVPAFHERQFHDWNRLGGERLVFLVRAERAAWHPGGTPYPLALRTHAWTLRDPVFDGPPVVGVHGGVATVVSPASGRTPLAFKLDFGAIDSFDEACAAARESAAYAAAAGHQTVPVPGGGRAASRLARLGTRGLRVPLDGRAERVARRWAVTPGYSEQAVAVLLHFKCDENARLLEGLLTNGLSVEDHNPGKGAGWRHYVRERAYRTLDRWGYAPRRPPIRGPDDFYRPVGAGHAAAALALVAAAAIAYAVVRRRRAARARPVPVPRAKMSLLPALSSALLAAVLLLLHADSKGHVNEITATVGHSRYWVSTYRGGLQFVRVVDWPRSRPLSFGRFDLERAPDALWDQGAVAAAVDARFAGFARVGGSMRGDLRATAYEYASVTVPFAGLAAVAALLPACQVAAWVWGRRRRRSRRRRGCCPACGYDLRGVPGATACAECGADVAAPAGAASAT